MITKNIITVADVANKKAPRSIVSKALRAVIVTSMTPTEMSEVTSENSLTLKYGRSAQSSGKKDMEYMLATGNAPSTKIRTFPRFSIDGDVEVMLTHMLCRINVSTLAYGTRDIPMNYLKVKANPTTSDDEKPLEFPYLVAKRSYKDMYMNYVAAVSGRTFSKSTFCKVAKLLIPGKQKSIKCVDYVVDYLLNVPNATIQHIITECTPIIRKDGNSDVLVFVMNYLKVHYDDFLWKHPESVRTTN
jgi:hypothetical protein